MTAHDYYRTLGHKQVWLWNEESPEGERQLEAMAKAMNAADGFLPSRFEANRDQYLTLARAALEALRRPQKAVTEVPEPLFILARDLPTARFWAWKNKVEKWTWLNRPEQIQGTYRGQYVNLGGGAKYDRIREELAFRKFTMKEI